jgi:polar amino acid transport system substrate-binding protein
MNISGNVSGLILGRSGAAIIFFLALFTAVSPGAAEGESVQLAALNWPPYIGENLTENGFGAEIIKTAFNRVGYGVTFSFLPWIRALKDANIGKYDAVCFAYYSEQRAKTYALSLPFVESALVFCKRREADIAYHTLQDLKPYRIGIVRGYVNTSEFDQAHYLQKEQANSELLNLKKLLNKRIDLTLIDKFVAQYLIHSVFARQATAFQFISPPLKIHPMYLMFSKNTKNYQTKLNAFNHGLQQIGADGTIARIMARHGFN